MTQGCASLSVLSTYNGVDIYHQLSIDSMQYDAEGPAMTLVSLLSDILDDDMAVLLFRIL